MTAYWVSRLPVPDRHHRTSDTKLCGIKRHATLGSQVSSYLTKQKRRNILWCAYKYVMHGFSNLYAYIRTLTGKWKYKDQNHCLWSYSYENIRYFHKWKCDEIQQISFKRSPWLKALLLFAIWFRILPHHPYNRVILNPHYFLFLKTNSFKIYDAPHMTWVW